MQAQITANTNKLRTGTATLSLDAQKKLQADIDADTKNFNRQNEDAQAEVEEQQGKIMQELGTKMMTILGKYATDNAFAVILDVGNQQQGTVLWAASGVDITPDIVKLYDDKYPLSAAAAPAAVPPAPPTYGSRWGQTACYTACRQEAVAGEVSPLHCSGEKPKAG